MTFSGALAYEMVINDGDQAAAGTGFNITANEQQSELVWDAKGSADNGLNYRANIQWRALGNGAGAGAFDETWLDFTGSFGRLYLGAEDGVTDLVAGTAGSSVQVGAWGTDGNNALRHVNFLGMDTGLGYYASHAGMTSDANKIGYVTPNMNGFTAGVSFSPNSSNGQQAGSNNDANANAWEFAAAYAGEIDHVSFAVDGSYGVADDKGGTGGADQEDISAWMIGAKVGFHNFSFAAAYLDNDDSGCPKATQNCDDGDAWNVGASYNFGPGAVSVMYQESEQDTDGNGNDDEVDIFHAGVNYKIAEGLSTHLNAYFFDLDHEAGRTNATSNDATVVILGTRVTF
jgi:predicted porin